MHLAYRWFCRLDLDDKVPHHSTFSENRLHRFRESDVFRHIFERVVAACMAAGLGRAAEREIVHKEAQPILAEVKRLRAELADLRKDLTEKTAGAS